MANDAIKAIVRYLVRISKPSRGPVLDIDPQSYRHTRHLENKKYAVDHVAHISEVEDPARMYAAIICSYVVEQMAQSEQRELIWYIKEHMQPTGYLVVSMLIEQSEDDAEEGLRARFDGWSRVRTSKSNTISFHTGDTHPCLDVILQKPEK